MLRGEEEWLSRFPWAEAKDSYGLGKGYLACSCGDGWLQLIWDMFEEIENLYKSKGLQIDLVIEEISEKYAGLRVNICKGIPEVYDIIEKFENQSETTCEKCGADGSIRDLDGWLKTYCDDCYKVEYETHLVRRGGYSNE
jgi:hypothetical protein